ncbi:glycosyltransferase family 4 protein [Halobacillus litoralis]|uniref:glycosyltransferase family 4 protein n=1 Tax=Halobacillus litoralis TaxID=45668 RepID=UPI001CD77530|nr:glycosyltransferase family 4 protein [Halobacillus litoralis]MCA0970973.1 glycosyltransferase family 4 protein [Halobacillus litoralis]
MEKESILLISHHFPPEIGAASNRAEHLTRKLSLHKDIHVITSHPNYPSSDLYKEINDYVKYEKYCKKVHRSPSITFKSTSTIVRLLNQIIFIFFCIFMAPFVMTRHKIAKFITTSPPFIVNLVGVYLTTFRKKWIMEIRDLWPDSAVAVNALDEKSMLFKYLKWFEHYCYERCNQIIVVTPRTKKLLVSRGIEPDKLTIITNGIPDWINNHVKTRTTDENHVNIMYIGNLGYAQGLSHLIDAASSKDDQNYNLYFVGEGSEKEKLVKYSEEKNLSNVHFINGISDKNKLASWYAKADIGVISLKGSELFKYVIPSKLFEYAGFKIPILLIGDGEIKSLIEKYNLGVSANANSRDINKMIDLIMKNRNDIECSSHEFEEEYSWDRLIKKYLYVLNTL